MSKKELWEYKLQIISHFYWEKKDHFELDVDTYSAWTVFALESGSFQYQIGSEKGVIAQNELIFCPPHSPLERKSLSSMALHFIVFNFETPLTNELKEEQVIPAFKSSPTDRIRLSSNFSYLHMLHLAMDTRSVVRKQWMLNDLWQLACNDWDTLPRRDDLAAFSNTEDGLMNWAMNWIITKAFTHFSIQELSNISGLSSVQFTRRFKKVYHMSPSEVIRIIRIRKTAKLLLDSQMTLDQIAEQCGYDNGFYLSRVFSKHMGISPSEFRIQNKV